MFTGLSAFPLTPLREDQLDEPAFERIMTRLVNAGVDSIGALGSTGSYAYLCREERMRVSQAAVEHAAGTPVVIGIGALRTSAVQALAHDAQEAGASGVLLAPVSYQALTDEEVFGLFQEVSSELSVPLVVYDNPGTTHFTFSLELYAAIAQLPHVSSIKIPPVPAQADAARQRVESIREILPEDVSIGVSGDGVGATGLLAGCDAWFSVLAGALPETALEITRAAQSGDAHAAGELSARLQPIWELFSSYGSLRVTAAIAEHLGLASPQCLPRPIRGLSSGGRDTLHQALATLQLA